ncbi:MAG: hypothetical protein ACXWMO_07155 [Syntrophales bacterium]
MVIPEPVVSIIGVRFRKESLGMCLAEGEEAAPSATGEKNNTSWR